MPHEKNAWDLFIMVRGQGGEGRGGVARGEIAWDLFIMVGGQGEGREGIRGRGGQEVEGEEENACDCFIIPHYSPHFWKVLLLWVLFGTPVVICFGLNSQFWNGHPLGYVELVVDFAFMIDMYLSFRTVRGGMRRA